MPIPAQYPRRRSLGACAALALAALTWAGGCATSPQPVDTSDPAIIARVKAELKSRRIPVRFLDLHCQSGVLTISGLVETYEQRREVDRMARRVRGVKQVVANLVVQE